MKGELYELVAEVLVNGTIPPDVRDTWEEFARKHTTGMVQDELQYLLGTHRYTVNPEGEQWRWQRARIMQRELARRAAKNAVRHPPTYGTR